MEVLKSSERFGKFVPILSETFPSPENFVRFEESEEACMMNQARIARRLKTSTARRLLAEAQSSTAYNSDGKSGTIAVRKGIRKRQIKDGPAPVELQMHEEHRVMKLTRVTILPKAANMSVGTLEAHVNGFIYTDRSGSIVIMHANVERYFLRLGDMLMPPLLQFHLQHPIMVGTKETNYIQFYMVPTPGGQVRSDKDSDNIETDKQTSNSSLNEDLKNFVHKTLSGLAGIDYLYIFMRYRSSNFVGLLPSVHQPSFP